MSWWWKFRSPQGGYRISISLITTHRARRLRKEIWIPAWVQREIEKVARAQSLFLANWFLRTPLWLPLLCAFFFLFFSVVAWDLFSKSRGVPMGLQPWTCRVKPTQETVFEIPGGFGFPVWGETFYFRENKGGREEKPAFPYLWLRDALIFGKYLCGWVHFGFFSLSLCPFEVFQINNLVGIVTLLHYLYERWTEPRWQAISGIIWHNDQRSNQRECRPTIRYNTLDIAKHDNNVANDEVAKPRNWLDLWVIGMHMTNGLSLLRIWRGERGYFWGWIFGCLREPLKYVESQQLFPAF